MFLAQSGTTEQAVKELIECVFPWGQEKVMGVFQPRGPKACTLIGHVTFEELYDTFVDVFVKNFIAVVLARGPGELPLVMIACKILAEHVAVVAARDNLPSVEKQALCDLTSISFALQALASMSDFVNTGMKAMVSDLLLLKDPTTSRM